MNIFLIGGAGYIGSVLSNYLFNNGHTITVLDNLKYNQIINFDKDINYINDSVNNLNKYKTLLDSSDVILYMVSPRFYETIDKNEINLQLSYLKKTLNLINNQKFLFFSSCSVYGSGNIIFNEQSNTSVTSPYSELKIKSENLILNSNKNIKILRISTLFGNSFVDRDDLLINNFINYAKNKREIELFDKKSYRPNIYLYDLIQILEKLIKINYNYNVINIGDNSLNTTKENIINIINNLYSNKIKVIYYDTNDSRNYKVNFDILSNLISYNFTPYQLAIKNMI
jgi:nucleoside-diphosphate-sugar epimerase